MAASQLTQHLFLLFTCKRGPLNEDPVDFVVLYDAWKFPATSFKAKTHLLKYFHGLNFFFSNS